MKQPDTSELTEKAFFFPGSGNRNLFGFLHSTDSAAGTTGIVYCHPFAEEKNMSHSVAVKAARMFAGAGYPVFRFDLTGCGDSEGELQTTSIDDWQQDLSAAIECFRQETGVRQCILWGLRMGAGLALLREQDHRDVAALVLWQPVLDFSIHLRQFLRRSISSQISKNGAGATPKNPADDLKCDGVVDVIGYSITQNFCNSLNDMGSKPAGVVPSVPTFILSISPMEQPAFALKSYAQRLDEAGTKLVLQHVMAEPFWDRYWQWESEKSAEATLQWLQGSL